MTSIAEIPLQPVPQSFPIYLNGTEYRLTVLYRAAPGPGWVLDIDAVDQTPIVGGLPLVTGADLLGQLAYLGLGVELWVQTDGNPDAVPTFANLGSTSHLYVLTQP